MSAENEKLIAAAKNYEGDNGTARWPALIRNLATALESADAEIARLREVIAEVRADAWRSMLDWDRPHPEALQGMDEQARCTLRIIDKATAPTEQETK